MHAAAYSQKRLSSIVSHGILSREFLDGKPKSSARYAAEFFRIPETMSIADYIRYLSSPEPIFSNPRIPSPFSIERMETKFLGGQQTARMLFFIDTEHGDIAPLLDMDAYRSPRDEIRELV